MASPPEATTRKAKPPPDSPVARIIRNAVACSTVRVTRNVRINQMARSGENFVSRSTTIGRP